MFRSKEKRKFTDVKAILRATSGAHIILQGALPEAIVAPDRQIDNASIKHKDFE